MMFEEAATLLERYSRTLPPAFGLDSPLSAASEVAERLEQLDYILHQLDRAQSVANGVIERFGEAALSNMQALAKGAAPDNPRMDIEDEAFVKVADLEIQVFAEAFYSCAFRIYALLRHRSQPLPGLDRLESAGIRDVHMRLVEASIEDSPEAMPYSFDWSDERGPVLALSASGAENSAWSDHGLYANAAEFNANLVQVLTRAVESKN